jgi:FKBP-type peptidyl-prolyl cis-trans isomerase FkpA
VTLRAAATILLVLMVLTVLAMRFLPELFWEPPPATPSTAPVAAAAAAPAEGEAEAETAAAPEAAAPEAAPTPVAPAASPTADPTVTPQGPAMPPTELQAQDLEPGSGAAVAAGQTAVVHYTGWLWDAAAPENKGRKFDSSRDHDDTFSFRVGGGQVIRGWDQGVEGMKVGGKRRLVIPPELGYGERGAGGVIPGGATLVFDVELMGIR